MVATDPTVSVPPDVTALTAREEAAVAVWPLLANSGRHVSSSDWPDRTWTHTMNFVPNGFRALTAYLEGEHTPLTRLVQLTAPDCCKPARE